jgi:hypothetical protein
MVGDRFTKQPVDLLAREEIVVLFLSIQMA